MRRGVALVLALALAIVATPVGAATAVKPKARVAHAAAPAHRDTVATPAVPAKPNFSGRWKLSMTRSDFGKGIPAGKPTARTDVIEQAEPRIRQTLYMNNGGSLDTTIYVYMADGKPMVNRVGGRDIKSVVSWEGTTLHLYSTAKLLVLDTSLDERWRLSPDGHTLAYTRHVKYGFGEGDQTLVFERE